MKKYLLSLISTCFVSSIAVADITLDGECIFPEGISASRDGTLYIGSMQQGSILRASTGGKTAHRFIEANSNGLVSTLGVYVDEPNNRLLACSADPGLIHQNVGDGRFDGSRPSGIKIFNLENGKPLESVDFPGGGFCNDLVSDVDGTIYATDSYHGRVMKYDGGKVSVFAIGGKLSDRLWTLNGIELSETGKDLFITNQKTGQIFNIEISKDKKASEIKEISLSRKFNADGIRFLPDGRLGAIEKGRTGKLNAINVETGEVITLADDLPSPATFVALGNRVFITSTQGENYWKADGSCDKAKKPFEIIEINLK
ncbi:SMP-30/gluconolactonase/LRE family protein [Parasalinivibrio latis]|uniref:SMP-30/gluconolactonase/LRE family protein n=1 Tax=Parasalinivibrio latis TaxID=2952610 RepID=UPI0030E1F23F